MISLWNGLRNQFEHPLPNEVLVISRLRQWMAVCCILLMMASWNLWQPQSIVPAVPLMNGFLDCSPVWDHVGCWLMIAGALLMISPLRNRRCSATGVVLFLLATLLMWGLNQLRIQAWSYQFLLLALLLLMKEQHAPRALKLIKLLTVSIYFHSALSKLDASFLQTHGEYLLAGFFQGIGLSLGEFSLFWIGVLPLMLPVGEMIIALGLCFQRTRRTACLLALLMHLILLLTFQTGGLNHEWGVLLWNIFFIGMLLLLFDPLAKSTPPSNEKRHRSPTSGNSLKESLIEITIATLMLLPFLEAWGYWDPWPSWALYASKPATLLLMASPVESETRNAFPPELRRHLEVVRNHEGKEVYLLNLRTWLLEELHVPPVPGVRYRIGVWFALSEALPAQVQLEGELQSRADRWSGHRTIRMLKSKDDFLSLGKRYWFNIVPR